jgi:hypothetical protein
MLLRSSLGGRYLWEENMKKSHEFVVTVQGSGIFPFDMLRYECAYPKRSEDAKAIGSCGTRVVTLVMPENPTNARWESFGWQVNEVLKELF